MENIPHQVLTDAKNHFISQWPNEGVGYVKNGEFFPLANLAVDKQHAFECSPAVMLEEPELLLHSHTIGYAQATHDARSPSKRDLEGQIATDVEWGICVTDGQTCDDPIRWGNPNSRPPLIGRDFIYNVQDCLSLAQDWYYADRGIRLPNFARNTHWHQDGEDHIGQNFEAFGFAEIDVRDIQTGDALLYQVRSPVPNHIGIYVGEGKVLSHWYGRISQEENYGLWARYIVKALRYQE